MRHGLQCRRLMTKPCLDSDRVVRELETLATFSDCPDGPPAVTRVVFTEQDLRARQYLAQNALDVKDLDI